MPASASEIDGISSRSLGMTKPGHLPRLHTYLSNTRTPNDKTPKIGRQQTDGCPSDQQRCGAFGCHEPGVWACCVEGPYVYPCRYEMQCQVENYLKKPVFGCKGTDGVVTPVANQTRVSATAEVPKLPASSASTPTLRESSPSSLSLPSRSSSSTKGLSTTRSSSLTTSTLSTPSTTTSTSFPSPTCLTDEILCGGLCYHAQTWTCCADGRTACAGNRKCVYAGSGLGESGKDYECKEPGWETQTTSTAEFTGLTTSMWQPSSAANRLRVPKANLLPRLFDELFHARDPKNKSSTIASQKSDDCPTPNQFRCGAFGCLPDGASLCCELVGWEGPRLFPCRAGTDCAVDNIDSDHETFGCRGADGVLVPVANQTLVSATVDHPVAPPSTLSSIVNTSTPVSPTSPIMTASLLPPPVFPRTTSLAAPSPTRSAICTHGDKVCGDLGCYSPSQSTCCGDGLMLCKSNLRCVIASDNGTAADKYQCKESSLHTNAVTQVTTSSMVDVPEPIVTMRRPSSAAGRLDVPRLFSGLWLLHGVAAQMRTIPDSSCPPGQKSCGAFGCLSTDVWQCCEQGKYPCRHDRQCAVEDIHDQQRLGCKNAEGVFIPLTNTRTSLRPEPATSSTVSTMLSETSKALTGNENAQASTSVSAIAENSSTTTTSAMPASSLTDERTPVTLLWQPKMSSSSRLTIPRRLLALMLLRVVAAQFLPRSDPAISSIISTPLATISTNLTPSLTNLRARTSCCGNICCPAGEVCTRSAMGPKCWPQARRTKQLDAGDQQSEEVQASSSEEPDSLRASGEENHAAFDFEQNESGGSPNSNLTSAAGAGFMGTVWKLNQTSAGAARPSIPTILYILLLVPFLASASWVHTTPNTTIHSSTSSFRQLASEPSISLHKHWSCHGPEDDTGKEGYFDQTRQKRCQLGGPSNDKHDACDSSKGETEESFVPDHSHKRTDEELDRAIEDMLEKKKGSSGGGGGKGSMKTTKKEKRSKDKRKPKRQGDRNETVSAANRQLPWNGIFRW